MLDPFWVSVPDGYCFLMTTMKNSRLPLEAPKLVAGSSGFSSAGTLASFNVQCAKRSRISNNLELIWKRNRVVKDTLHDPEKNEGWFIC